jgi:hypothetical protein
MKNFKLSYEEAMRAAHISFQDFIMFIYDEFLDFIIFNFWLLTHTLVIKLVFRSIYLALNIDIF